MKTSMLLIAALFVVTACTSKDDLKKLIKDNQEKLKVLSGALLEKEVLNAEEVKRMLGLEIKDEDSSSG